MSEEELSVLVRIHVEGERQGPGSDDVTRTAIRLAGLSRNPELRIADLGCGTGAASLVLADELGGQVSAIDGLEPFIERLRERATIRGLGHLIHAQVGQMERLDFLEESLDVIWSEGAIYHLGFERGVREWKPFLKLGGILAVSEITWLTSHRPAEVEDFWTRQYPEIDLASGKLAALERQGYSPVGYFTLPTTCWLEGYYGPLQRRMAVVREASRNNETVQQVVAAEIEEMALYERFCDYYSYGFYIARRVV